MKYEDFGIGNADFGLLGLLTECTENTEDFSRGDAQKSAESYKKDIPVSVFMFDVSLLITYYFSLLHI